MSSIENFAKEVSRRKMQRLIPLLGEKNTKLRIQVRILRIRNRCDNATQKRHLIISIRISETKMAIKETKRTEPVSPVVRALQQFGAVEREELNDSVVAVTLHGVDDVEA